MKGALAAFGAEVHRLKTFLERAKAESSFFGSIGEIDAAFAERHAAAISTLINTATNNRRYGYFLSIIVMYGALERFVEDACQEYVIELSKQCEHPDQLPQTIRAAHIALSIDHLSLLQNGKMQDKTEIPTIIEQVAACLKGVTPVELNVKAFTLRSGNMNFDRVKTIFKGLGVLLIPKRVAAADGFKVRYDKLYGKSLDLSSAEVLERVFLRIDDLVAIRNKIAHGVIDTDQIEEIELIEERLADLENFVFALTAVLEQEILLFTLSLGRLRPLGALIQVFNNRIVCVELNEGFITVGDMIAVPTGDAIDPIRYGSVISIQVDKVDQKRVAGAPGVKVGLKVDFRAKDTGNYFALPDEVSRLLRAS